MAKGRARANPRILIKVLSPYHALTGLWVDSKKNAQEAIRSVRLSRLGPNQGLQHRQAGIGPRIIEMAHSKGMRASGISTWSFTLFPSPLSPKSLNIHKPKFHILRTHTVSSQAGSSARNAARPASLQQIPPFGRKDKILGMTKSLGLTNHWE
jgi:hypothetical protein